MLKILPLLFSALLGSCRSTAVITMEPEAGVEFLAQCLTGTFDSSAQAEAEPDEYRPIRLTTSPIWTDRTDGPWLYAERASMAALDLPYRQLVYRLSATESGFRSEVFELPAPAQNFAGQSPEAFETLSPQDLSVGAGCSIDLELIALDGCAAFAGSTAGKDCSSSRNGAAYATSIVTLGSELLENWDRGFDAEGEQVWGAVPGPYRFVRVPGTFPIPGH